MQELVVESLVVSLAMVVFYVLVDETTQMPLAERDHACETLLVDRPDEALARRWARRDLESLLVFHRDDIPIRRAGA